MSLKQRIDQTKRYYKRNGLVKTAAAVAERTLVKDNPEFAFKEVPGEELAKQRETGTDNGPKISVLVPAFETKEKYFIELIDCMLRQTYTNWELVIADASAGNRLSGLVIEDERIRYVKLSSNRGISNNTNEALKVAPGKGRLPGPSGSRRRSDLRLSLSCGQSHCEKPSCFYLYG